MVVAEDGVTSNRYYLSVYRNFPTPEEEEESEAPAPAPSNALAGSDAEDYEDLTISLATSQDFPTAAPPPAIPLSAQAHASESNLYVHHLFMAS